LNFKNSALTSWLTVHQTSTLLVWREPYKYTLKHVTEIVSTLIEKLQPEKFVWRNMVGGSKSQGELDCCLIKAILHLKDYMCNTKIFFHRQQCCGNGILWDSSHDESKNGVFETNCFINIHQKNFKDIPIYFFFKLIEIAKGHSGPFNFNSGEVKKHKRKYLFKENHFFWQYFKQWTFATRLFSNSGKLDSQFFFIPADGRLAFDFVCYHGSLFLYIARSMRHNNNEKTFFSAIFSSSSKWIHPSRKSDFRFTAIRSLQKGIHKVFGELCD